MGWGFFWWQVRRLLALIFLLKMGIYWRQRCWTRLWNLITNHHWNGNQELKKKDENLDCAGNKIFRINYHAPGYSLAAKCKDRNCLLDATKMPIISQNIKPSQKDEISGLAQECLLKKTHHIKKQKTWVSCEGKPPPYKASTFWHVHFAT